MQWDFYFLGFENVRDLHLRSRKLIDVGIFYLYSREVFVSFRNIWELCVELKKLKGFYSFCFEPL